MDFKLYINCFPEIFKELFIKQNFSYNDNDKEFKKKIISTLKVFKGELTFFSYGIIFINL